LSALTHCNWRAGFFLFVLPAILLALVVPALGYWYDPAGVAEDFFGNSMTELPDINGDGYDEFLIGIAGSDVPGADAGQVFLWYGGPEVKQTPDRILSGTALEFFGWSLANIGDVNGGGKEDFAVGAPLSNAGGTARGRVCIFYGENDPLSSTPDLIISGQTGGHQFGYSVSAAGDFDGDGRDDFIVGAPYANIGRGLTGAAYVIYGKSGGPSTDLADATAFSGEVAEDRFGWSVSDAGNFLGGNEDCVAVGAPLANTHGGLDAGAVYVFEGKLGGATPDTTIDFVRGISDDSKANSQFGFAVRGVKRIDGDGYDDLAVGAPAWLSERGRVEIFYGDPSPSLAANHAISGETGFDSFGWALDRVADFTGNGRSDILIGAPDHDAPASNSGRAYLYEGGSSTTTAGGLEILANTSVIGGNEANDRFGWAVAAAGDFDGDGMPDYAVAAPMGNNGETNAVSGVVTLTLNAIGPVPALLRNWKARWSSPDEVNLVFTLSLPAAGLADFTLIRQGRDEAGTIRNEQLLWSGPARLADTGATNTLAQLDGGFIYRDDASAVTSAGLTISYGLSIMTDDGQSLRLADLAGPGTPPAVVPVALALAPAWPNPANPAVTIRFRAAANEIAQVQILDVRGRVVRELHQSAGAGDWQNIIWNGLTDDGRAAASGVYLIRLSAGLELRTQRVVLAR